LLNVYWMKSKLKSVLHEFFLDFMRTNEGIPIVCLQKRLNE